MENEFVRVVFKGRPVFHGTRDPRTGQVLTGGWDMDDLNPWSLEWDSRKYDLFPDRDAFLPFAALCSYFGDPRSTDRVQSYRDQHGRVGFIPDRPTEIRRLRTKYGNMFGDESVVEHHPMVECYDLDGASITTVLDDPEGRTTIPVQKTAAQDGELLDIVRRQQQTINKLMETVGLNPQQPQAQMPREATEQPQEPSEPRDGPPEDDSLPAGSEALTGERGGRQAGAPPLDFSTLNAES